ncbi:MAG: hemin uptake protein HemP [Pseudomonadota bacterium]
MSRGPAKTRPERPDGAAVIEASSLFRGRREIQIEYRGEIYRLRITRNERLILTK